MRPYYASISLRLKKYPYSLVILCSITSITVVYLLLAISFHDVKELVETLLQQR